MKKTISFFLIVSPILLASCTTVRNEIANTGGSGFTRFLYIVGGLIMLIVGIGIMMGLAYALRRWRFLEIIKPHVLLSRIPVIGPYFSKAKGINRDLRRISSFDKSLAQFGLSSDKILEGDTNAASNRMAASSGQGQLGGSASKYLPKEMQSYTKKTKGLSVSDLRQRGKSVLTKIWRGETDEALEEDNEAVEEAGVLHEQEAQPGLSARAAAATAAYLSGSFIEPQASNNFPTAVSLSSAAAAASTIISQLAQSTPVLIVTMPQEHDQYFQVEKNTLIIGSAEEADIRLSSHELGGKHLQIDRSDHGWHVTDLGSISGTYLDTSQLLASVPEVWATGLPIKIGDITIRLVEMSQSEYDAIFQSGRTEKPSVTIFPTEQKIEAGQTSVWQAHVTNQGKTVEHYGVFVSGVEPEWVQMETLQKPLMPGESSIVSFSITPPRHFSATAGVYTCFVRVQAISDSDTFVVGDFKCEILPYENWESELSHHQLFEAQDAHVQLQNLSNHAAQMCMSADVDQAHFLLQPLEEPKTYLVEPGASLSIPISIVDLKRPWLGRVHNEAFTLNSASASGEFSLQHPGVVQIKPIIPLWLVSILGFIVPFVCLFATIAYTFVENRNAAATATAEAIALANLALIPTMTPIPTTTPRPIVLPSSCRTYKVHQAEIDNLPDPDVGWLDGEVELYANGDAQLPMTIYCHDMASNAPTEYITLINTGEPFNFSSYMFPDGAITSIFSKVRVNPVTLEIDGTDRRFAEIIDLRADQVVDTPDFGRTKGCTIEENVPVSGRANINLEGTEYTIAPDSNFQTFGKDLGEHLIEFSNQNQVLELQVNGNCGWLYHSEPLKLWLKVTQDQ
ncbi:MAG: GON domain-containing protein [Anaerolineae bacterium]